MSFFFESESSSIQEKPIERTSLKNFVAPDVKAFCSAAAKSCVRLVSTWGDGGMGMCTRFFLTDVSHESVYLVSLLNEPCEDARGI